MATYRIVCVTTKHAHRHITSVGVGTFAGVLFHLFTVQQVRDKLDSGDTFYTISLSTGRRTEVKKDTCGVGGLCAVKTIRSKADAVRDNNLDFLSPCP
jgi:hypothetical protein